MLHFNDLEREQIKIDLEQMIGFVDKLQELDTTGVEPLIHMNSHAGQLREDVPGNMLSREEVFLNAPNHDGRYFIVPKVIKKTDQ